MNKLQAGKILKPIKIALKGEKAYIISGVEKFIASILTQKPVAKLIVNKEIKKIVSVDKDWFKIVL